MIIMKTRKTKLGWLMLLSVIVMLSACSTPDEDASQRREKVLVELTPVENSIMDNELHMTGVVRAFEEAYIGAATPSRIEKIYVDVGDRVEKGQLLVQMDRTQLFQARVQLDNLREDLRRMDTLLALGAVTQQNVDQLKAQYDIARSNVDNLAEHTRITAPIAGVVTGRYNSDGEIFSMTPTPAGKPAIVSLNQITPVKIMVGVSERFFNDVSKGQDVLVTTEVYPGRSFQGIVNRIYPTIDRMTGSFQVEIIVDNRDLALRPGMFARVAVNLGEMETLVVPALAVRKQVGSDERFVFVVEHEMAHRRVVTLGRTFGDRLEILSGIEPGELLVTNGQHNLMDQTAVDIVN